MSVVGEDHVEIGELGSVGVVVELSDNLVSLLALSAVLNTSDGDPEVSGLGLALIPLSSSNLNRGVGLSQLDVLVGSTGGEGAIVISGKIEIPRVKVMDLVKTLNGGPGDIEILSNVLVIDVP